MTEQEKEKSVDNFIKIVETAKRGNHFKFEFIKSLGERKAAKILLTTYKKIIKACKTSSKFVLKEYKKMIATAEDTAELITYISDMDICVEFYTKEVNTIYDMLDEFRSYLWSGHFLDIYLFNRTREEKDMIDMRGYTHESDSRSDNEGC